MTNASDEHPPQETLARLAADDAAVNAVDAAHVRDCKTCRETVEAVREIIKLTKDGQIPPLSDTGRASAREALRQSRLRAEREEASDVALMLGGRASARPAVSDTEARPAGPTKPAASASPSTPDRDRDALLQDASRWRSRANWLAVAAAVLLIFPVLSGVEFAMLTARNGEIARLQEERDQAQRELEIARSEATTEFPFALTSGGVNRPVDWATLLEQHYDPAATPEENLQLLEKVGGAQIRETIAEIRKKAPAADARRILKSLFNAWGGPNESK